MLQAITGGTPTWFGIEVPFNLGTIIVAVCAHPTGFIFVSLFENGLAHPSVLVACAQLSRKLVKASSS